MIIFRTATKKRRGEKDKAQGAANNPDARADGFRQGIAPINLENSDSHESEQQQAEPQAAPIKESGGEALGVRYCQPQGV